MFRIKKFPLIPVVYNVPVNRAVSSTIATAILSIFEDTAYLQTVRSTPYVFHISVFPP